MRDSTYDSRKKGDSNGADLDASVTRALEAVPRVAIAEDFALRVMQRVPASSARSRVLLPERSRVGRWVMLASMVALAGLMLGLAPWAWGARNIGLTVVEWVLCCEFVGLALWLSPLPRMFER